MITLTYCNGKETTTCEWALGADIPENRLCWIDLVAPTGEERKSIEQKLGIEIPSKTEVWKNNVLNRLYHEDGVTYMTASLISKADSPHPTTSAVTFITGKNYLLTVHDISPTSFKNFLIRLQRPHEKFVSPAHLLAGLFEEIIDRVAFNSELVVGSLDELSHDIFGVSVLDKRVKKTSQSLKTSIKKLGAAADLNSQINESLHSISRLLVFSRQISFQDSQAITTLDLLISDTSALKTQCAFLSDKITFLLDATLGLINVEQNVIIKIFSVVAVFFMPPTLVGTIYGMNFHYMPELDWFFGYPMALGIMLLCALLSYFYFRKKGWL
jgi:magnesium transporter